MSPIGEREDSHSGQIETSESIKYCDIYTVVDRSQAIVIKSKAKMTFQQELSSWNPFSKPQHAVQKVPEVGTQAPSTPQLRLPRSDGKPVVMAFMRHCGCPFTEKVFVKLREVAEQNPEVQYIGISHSNQLATDNWLKDVGGAGKVEVVVDDSQESFSMYGLGLSSFWAVLNPSSLYAAINLGKTEGYNVRPTESGSRWQQAGVFAVDTNGKIVYSHKAQTSDDLGDLEAALKSVQAPPRAQL